MKSKVVLLHVGLALAFAGGCSHAARTSTGDTGAPGISPAPPSGAAAAGVSPETSDAAATPSELGSTPLDSTVGNPSTTSPGSTTLPQPVPPIPVSTPPTTRRAATVGASTTAVRVAVPSTPGARPTIPFAPPGSAATSTTKEAQPTALSRICDGARTGDQHFDLAHISVQQQPSSYVFAADYTGDPAQHDTVVRFNLADSTYAVVGELFEDGVHGVADFQDLSTKDSTLLVDAAQVVSAGQVKLTVTDDLIARIAGQPFTVTVTLKVDGLPIESC